MGLRISFLVLLAGLVYAHAQEEIRELPRLVRDTI